jgi:hypothetical protein
MDQATPDLNDEAREMLGRLAPSALEAGIQTSSGKVALAWMNLERAMVGGQGDPLAAGREFMLAANLHRAFVLRLAELRKGEQRTPPGG